MTKREANQENNRRLVAGLRWFGMGWYASRCEGDGILTEKVMDAEDATYNEEASRVARENGLGTPFFLIFPEEIVTD